jgi:TonB-linked SusC/RagA family outer membrane protein
MSNLYLSINHQPALKIMRNLNIKHTLFTAFLVVIGFNLSAQGTDSVKTDKVKPVTAKNQLSATGTVKDAATGKPITGMSVSVPGFSSSFTDDKGRFSVHVPNYEITLVISGPGYQQKDVPLKSRRNISASLFEESFNSIYDQAALLTGTAQLNKTSSAVAAINTQGGWELNSETPETYLQGRVSGLNVVRRSGTPGEGADLFLRGFTSLNTRNQPLIVVDGMVYDNTSYGNSIISGHVDNALQHIDVKDIDKITVIKDATASVYGARSANGVIMITTSHAKELTTKIDFGVFTGLNFTPKPLPVMEAGDQRIYLSELLKSGGATDAQIAALPYMNDNPSNGTYYNYHNNTDWQKEVFKQSQNQNYYLKVTGGDDIARYSLSMGYTSNKGITRETDQQRYNTRFNADFNMSKRLVANANLAFTYSEQKIFDQGLSPKTNPLYIALVKSPLVAPNLFNAEGIASPLLAEADTFNVSNPASLIKTAELRNKNYRFSGAINFKYEISNAISLSTLIGVNYDKVRENVFIPRKGTVPDTLLNSIAQNRLGSQVKRLFSVYNDTRLSFTKTYNHAHQISAALGFRFNNMQTEQDFAFGYNSPTDQFISVGTGLNALRALGGDIGNWRWLNNYLTADYSYLDKYFVSANVSLDGSSRFGKDVKEGIKLGGQAFAVLPSVAAAWLVSSEDFMKDVAAVDLLKIRASFGLTANDDIGNYNARQYYISQNLLGMQGLVRGNIANPELQWENVRKANLGLDAAFFNERLSFSVDVYNHKTSKMLIYEPIEVLSGLGFALTNSGGMRTNGIDVGLNSRLVNTAVWKWDAGFTVGTYKTKITELPQSIYNSYAGGVYISEVGQQANLFYGYQTNGVFESNAAAAASGLSAKTPQGTIINFTGGDMRFVDTNGDKIIDDKDRVVIGNPNPDFFGSFTNRVSWKRWTADVQFTFSKGNDIYNYTRRNLESLSSTNNQTLAVNNRWKADGQVTNIPKASLGDPMGNSRFSDRWIEDGSYLRLRTIALSYDLPIKNKFIKYAKLYATGNNVFTLSKYLGYDPEFSASGSIYTQGTDTTLEPQFRSVQLGARIGL